MGYRGIKPHANFVKSEIKRIELKVQWEEEHYIRNNHIRLEILRAINNREIRVNKVFEDNIHFIKAEIKRIEAEIRRQREYIKRDCMRLEVLRAVSNNLDNHG